MVMIVFPVIFALALLGIIAAIYRFVNAVPVEDRTFSDKPPRLIGRVWLAVQLVAHYVGPYLTIQYRETTIKRLRRAELDYALSPQQWVATTIVYAVLVAMLFKLVAIELNAKGLVWPVSGAIMGLLYLELWMRDRIKLIELQIVKGLPNFLDMLTLSVESGCNLTVGIGIAVEKSPDSPLRRGFQRLLREIRSGRSRVDALRALESRLDLNVITSLVTAMVQAEKTGASLGAVLRAQSTQRTNERFARAEKMAMEAPVKMLGPLILCIFPCTFIVIGFPIAMKLMNAF
jgi:tight adherence protein C